jgi:uncharacterized protein (TIGR03084 family)
MGLDYPDLLDDLRHESDQLISCLSGLAPEQWSLPTPASGWRVHDQVSHLAFFDDTTRLAITDTAGFQRKADELMAGGMDFPDRIAAEYRTKLSREVLEWFVEARRQLLAAFAGEDPRRRLPWFGPEMSVASSATARLMETWAHGQDVYDTLAVSHPPSPGLRSIAHLGVATFGFAHTLHGIDVPDQSVAVRLYSPEGEVWVWGPEHSDNQVVGPAEDFVLTVTQRRHWTQTALTVQGPVAKRWLDIAQAFAGAPSRRGVPR